MKFENPHIPTFIGILILLVGLAGAIFLIENSTSLFSQAGTSKEPKNVHLANITDSSFTVAWTTDSRTLGSIEYKEKGLLALPLTAFDTRDVDAKTNRSTHFVNVTGLKPETQYEIKITTNTAPSSWSVTTGKILSAPPQTIDPAFGTLVDQQNRPLTEALVFVSFSGSQTLATFVNSDGSWVVPVGLSRSNDGSRYFIPSLDDSENLLFISPEGHTQVTTTIENDSPLPSVRIGETYQFSRGFKKLRGPIIAAAHTFSTVTGSVNSEFQVLLPTPDSAIPSYKPAFKGTGVKGKNVIITLSSENTPQLGKTAVDANGNWTWTPPTSLLPGDYTASITSFNQTNEPLTTTVSFIVLKSGTQILGDATPSASIQPSPSASASASPIASESSVPVTGTWEPTIAVLLMGLGLFIFGCITFAKKNIA